jgi:hypothetical protein
MVVQPRGGDAFAPDIHLVGGGCSGHRHQCEQKASPSAKKKNHRENQNEFVIEEAAMPSFELSLVNAELPSLQPPEVAIHEPRHHRKTGRRFCLQEQSHGTRGCFFPGMSRKDASCDHLNVMAFISAEPPKQSGRA